MKDWSKLWEDEPELGRPGPDDEKIDFEAYDKSMAETRRKLREFKNVTDEDLRLFVGH